MRTSLFFKVLWVAWLVFALQVFRMRMTVG